MKMALELKPILPKVISFWITGNSPMIQHAWSDKGLRMMRMTAAERKKQPKVARDPESEAMDAMYKTEDGEPGLPMLAFKSALIAAAHKDLGIEKTLVRKALFLPAWAYGAGLIAPMQCSDPIIREDIVRVGAGQTDLRYRPEFSRWRVNVIVEIDSDLLNEQDVINLINRAGFSVGIGEWRPEKGGEFGRFEFDTSMPIAEVSREELEAAA
jgi:hypothetical protein